MARGIDNQFIDDFHNKDVTILDYPIQNALTAKMRKAAKELHNTNFMSLWAGQSAFACRDIGATELMRSLVAEIETWHGHIDH